MTQKSLAQLQAGFLNNIGADDLNDLIDSFRPGHGSISITTPADTVIAASDTWYQALGTYAEGPVLHNWEMTSTGRLYYTGSAPRHCHIACSFSATCTGSNKVLEFTILKNGAESVPSTIERKLGTGSDVGSSAMHDDFLMTKGDYIAIGVKNTTSGTDAQLTKAYLFVLDMIT